jgi:ABC-2 type transport system ATP-binding protein
MESEVATGAASASTPSGRPASDGGPAIQVVDLVKRFDEIEAVRGVSFSVAPGEIFGFLGPNGAGKSTAISMLCTLLVPTSGRATVGGFDVVARRAEVRRRIGLVFQDTTLGCTTCRWWRRRGRGRA